RVLGTGEMLEQRLDAGQHAFQDVVPTTHVNQQPVGGVDRVGDVVALLVELGGEGVQLAQEGPDLAAPPVGDVEDLVLQDFQVRDPATVQDQRQTGQRLLDRGKRGRVLQWNGVAVLE